MGPRVRVQERFGTSLLLARAESEKLAVEQLKGIVDWAIHWPTLLNGLCFLARWRSSRLCIADFSKLRMMRQPDKAKEAEAKERRSREYTKNKAAVVETKGKFYLVLLN